jgi:hypothetical protein
MQVKIIIFIIFKNFQKHTTGGKRFLIASRYELVTIMPVPKPKKIIMKQFQLLNANITIHGSENDKYYSISQLLF